MIKQLLKKNKWIAFAFFLFCTISAQAQTPVEKYGQLQIKNGKVSDKDGNPVVLRGMSMFWSGYPEGSPFYNAQTVKWLRDDWCVDVVRAAMSVEQGNTNYVGNASAELAKIETVIDACIDNGLYVIVDFHTHNAPNYMNQAKTFFTHIANKYGDLPNIIYEPYNEPIAQDWSSVIKPYHNEIISTIRAIDDNNIIVCGTKNYSQDVDEAANDPVTGTNVAYTLHYYANSHKSALRQKCTNALNRGVAIFATEYGTCNASGNGGYNATESQIWWDYLEANKISSCNWSISNKAETASVLTPGTYAWDNWSSNQLTESGKLVKAYLSSKCGLTVTTGSVTLSFTGNQTQYEVGETVEISAATTVANGSIANVKFYSGTTEIGMDNSSPYSFSTSTLAPGGHDITARSFDASGNLIAVSPLYVITVVGASNVSTTGITDQFESEDQFVELTGGVNGETCASATDAAAAGIFWFQDTDPATAFEAIATREGDGTLKYVISQEAASYNVVGFNFGEYCDNGTKKKYMLDLSQNAVLNLTVTSPATNTATLDLKFQMKDADGNVLGFNKTVLGTDGDIVEAWYQHEIGFSKNHVAPDYVALTPGTTTNFVFDFKDALTVSNPNDPDLPTDINDNNDAFDYSRVTEIVIIPVNSEDNGEAGGYAPLAFTDQEVIFSGLTMGDPSLGEDFCTTPVAPTASDVTHCQGETDISELTATGTDGLYLKWYTSETGGVASETAPIPSTSVATTYSYYVSQAVSETSTCEGPRTKVDVEILDGGNADAGEPQTMVSGPNVDLTGTGTEVGTWALVSGPTGVNVTFDPSATSESVTAKGLSEVGDYVFSYTVSGNASCPDAVSEVSVQVETVTSSNELFLDNHTVAIYPNPVNNNLHIDLGNAEDIQSINLIDVTGRVVYSVENVSSTNINMSEFSKGMYFVQVQSESGTLVKSIVK